MGSHAEAKIPLGRYLWERIKQVGVSTIFGVPGDFNLELLDYIYEVPGLKWVGNSNELNGAYAADGYARIKNVPGVMVTTHGVGELSALNGIAGAASEQVKLIHVVGQTRRVMQDNHMMIHHSIGDKPDHQVYNKTSKLLRRTAAELWDKDTAPAEIDRVIRECFLYSLPVYIFMPLDLSWEEVPASLLDTHIDLTPPADDKAQSEAVDAIKEALSSSKDPCFLVDALTHRHNATDEATSLIDRLRFPTYCSNMGKGIVDEDKKYYVGVYNGQVSSEGLAKAFEQHDLVVVLGNIYSDTNGGGFTRKISADKNILINPHDCCINGKTYSSVWMKPFLQALDKALSHASLPTPSIPHLPSPRYGADAKDASSKHITQSWVWHRFANFLKPNDIVIAETGTSCFGLCDVKFPAKVRFVTQIYYGSIGYCAASTLGVSIAAEEREQEKGDSKARVILVTGDGSLNLTVQEVATMCKEGVKPILVVINNRGYTIERIIHGARQTYNDVANMNYKHMLAFFNHPSPDNSFWRAETKEDFEKVLEEKALDQPDNVKVLEVIMEKNDVPWRLCKQLALRGEPYISYLKEEGFMDKDMTLDEIKG